MVPAFLVGIWDISAALIESLLWEDPRGCGSRMVCWVSPPCWDFQLVKQITSGGPRISATGERLLSSLWPSKMISVKPCLEFWPQNHSLSISQRLPSTVIPWCVCGGGGHKVIMELNRNKEDKKTQVKAEGHKSWRPQLPSGSGKHTANDATSIFKLKGLIDLSSALYFSFLNRGSCSF